MLIDANTREPEPTDYDRVYAAIRKEVISMSGRPSNDLANEEHTTYRTNIRSHHKFFIATDFPVVTDVVKTMTGNIIIIRRLMGGNREEYGLIFTDVFAYSPNAPIYPVTHDTLFLLFGGAFVNISIEHFKLHTLGAMHLPGYIGWIPLSASIMDLQNEKSDDTGWILGYARRCK